MEVSRGDSFTVFCWEWSWKIRMTDKTDAKADRIPRRDKTMTERWL
jgi:hypothetical protein